MRELEKKSRNINKVESFKKNCWCSCYCHCGPVKGPSDQAEGETEGENFGGVY